MRIVQSVHCKCMCYKKETFFFFFFASLVASPFHPRAITSTAHMKSNRVVSGKGSQQFLNSRRDKEASRKAGACVGAVGGR